MSLGRTQPAVRWIAACLLPLALAAPADGAPEEPRAQLPPPLVAPEVAAPDDGARLAPRAAPTITFEERVLELVNLERRANGDLPPLKGVSALDTSSETHSFNMADRDFFAHCDLDTKKTLGTRLLEAGYVYSFAGENIAAGYATPEGVMAGWMASPGHRGNVLSTSFREIGVGFFEQATDQANVRRDFNLDCDGADAGESGHGPYYRYWTQNFGRRNAVYPLVIERDAHDTVCAELDLYVYGPANATQMRFMVDGGGWSAWMPYSPQATVTLPGASGSPVTVSSEVTDGSTTYPAEDEITLASGFPAPPTLDLLQQTVGSTESFEACDTISAVSGFTVAATGDVTFRAGRRVVLGDGFAVLDGGSFAAVIASPP